MTYELHHGDGGHCGPFPSIDAAVEYGSRIARDRVEKLITPRAHEWIFEIGGGPDPVKTLVAKRCRDCNEVHVCVTP